MILLPLIRIREALQNNSVRYKAIPLRYENYVEVLIIYMASHSLSPWLEVFHEMNIIQGPKKNLTRINNYVFASLKLKSRHYLE